MGYQLLTITESMILQAGFLPAFWLVFMVHKKGKYTSPMDSNCSVPIGSMGLVYLPRYTIKIQPNESIPYTGPMEPMGKDLVHQEFHQWTIRL